jgi:hypothetical protein
MLGKSLDETWVSGVWMTYVGWFDHFDDIGLRDLFAIQCKFAVALNFLLISMSAESADTLVRSSDSQHVNLPGLSSVLQL